MSMNKVEEVEAYTANVTKAILKKWNGVVRVWSEPMSAIEGSQVLDEITAPTEVTVFEEQRKAGCSGTPSPPTSLSLPEPGDHTLYQLCYLIPHLS